MSAAAQQYQFQSEVQQLLKLMINSLYSNREIFIRELISNAADALDKLRYEAINSSELLGEDSQLKIRIVVNSKARTLSISDNGIGMNSEEAINNLGTIARSGSAEFLEQLNAEKRNEANIIGQFGVGFYSAFMVADKVEVFTRRATDSAEAGVHWSSIGDGNFQVEPHTKAERGTRVLLHLKKDAREFAERGQIQSLVQRYSEHISFEVFLEDANASKKDKESAEQPVNSATAIWSRRKQEVSDEEYREFYKQLSHDFTDPLTWSHNKIEGKLSYTSLLYAPGRAPYDLWNRDAPRGLKLYIQRVFIMDNAEAFLPLYLRFIKGVVDCSDLELNVSRELLQQDPNSKKLRAALTKRALTLLQNLAKNPEDYATFWEACGQALKEGVIEDQDNREQVMALLRFRSTHDNGQNASHSLDDYLSRAPADQKEIYYLQAKELNSALLNPQLEIFRSRNFEVLLFTDRIDEWVAPHMFKYKDKELKSIVDVDVDQLAGADQQSAQLFHEERVKEFAPLCRRLKEHFGDKVQDVLVSKRLSASAVCLVGDNEAGNAQLQQFMRMSGQKLPESKPIMEINAKSSLIKKLDQASGADFEQLADILHFEAQLSLGAIPEDSRNVLELINARLAGVEWVPPQPVAAPGAAEASAETSAATVTDAEIVADESEPSAAETSPPADDQATPDAK